MFRRLGFYGFLVIMLSFSMVFLGCAKPPTMEIENAENAVTDAKQKEANLYAQDVFKQAQDSLKKAKDLVAVKKYKEAKQGAIETVTIAQQSVSMVEANKAKMKTDAEQMSIDVQAGLDEVKSLVSKATKKKAPINREEIQGMIGKWEVGFVTAKDQLQAGKIRDAHDMLKAMQEEIKAQKETVAVALEPKIAEKIPAEKKQFFR